MAVDRITSTPRVRTPPFGTRADRLGAVRAGLAAVALTATYVVAVRWASPTTAPTSLEVFGTATSLASVMLTRTQNIWAIITGLVSVVAMGVFFFDIGLVGQGWLHLGYYIPVQLLGWWAWLRAGADRSDLPVGWLRPGLRLALAAGVVVGTVLLALTFRELHGESPYLVWDASIVAASVAAQLLLTAKRIESWWLWLVPIDVSAILLYLRTDAEMFAALYAVYLVLATLGLRDWSQAWRRQQAGLTAVEARVAATAASAPVPVGDPAAAAGAAPAGAGAAS
jgi:nicotinamide mononucleotide transporter